MLNLNRLRVGLLIAAMIAAAGGSPKLVNARATFQLNILDSIGEGFNDPGTPDPASTIGGNVGVSLGDQRRIAFAAAAQIWAGRLDSSVTIVVGANFDPLPCDAMEANLGAAGTTTVHRDFIRAPVSNTWYPAALANALAGTDLAPDSDDIEARFNSDLDGVCAFPLVWYYGLDGNPPAGTLDFISVVLHELAHGLGFQTFMDTATGARLGGFDDAFLLWLEDHSTGELLSDMALNADRTAANVNTGNLHWVGPDVIAAGAGLTSGRHPSGHVEMYAPDPLDPGSSVSHFSSSLSSDELMKPSFTGAKHDVGLAGALMQDIGWSSTVSPSVPPTATSSGGSGGGCFIHTITGYWSQAN